MERIFYPAVFHPEDVGYSVAVPDLDGCFSEGDSLDEAYTNTLDAVGLFLTDIEVQKLPLPKASEPRGLAKEEAEFIVMVEFDMLAYKKRHDTRAVKKTLTIPSWLNSLAEERNINFSGVLKQALIEKLEIQ